MWRLPPPNALSPAALKLRAQTTINSRGRTDHAARVQSRRVPLAESHQPEQPLRRTQVRRVCRTQLLLEQVRDPKT